MATVYDLKEALKKALQQQGTLDQLKASIRSEVFHVLNDDTVPPPKLANTNLLINELIREYAQFNNYKHSVSVLTAESGLSKEPMDREFLKSQFNILIDDSEQPLPLLYSMVEYFIKRKQIQSYCTNPVAVPDIEESAFVSSRDNHLLVESKRRNADK